MTDLEINKALALAIGWKDEPNKMRVSELSGLQVWIGYWANFGYRDWNVIGPIAERYDCFPKKASYGGWVNNLYVHTTTPQRAIALAVIGAEK